MAINKKLINFKTKSLFTSANGIGTIDKIIKTSQIIRDPNVIGRLRVGNIPYSSIVTIEDTGEIWSHGRYLGDHTSIDDLTKIIESNKLETDATLDLIKYDKLNYYTKDEINSLNVLEFDINISLDPARWVSTGIIVKPDVFTHGNGTYLIQLIKGNTIYSGIVPIYIAKDNSSDTINTSDEIILSKMGQENETLYLKLEKSDGYIFGEFYLSSDVKNDAKILIKLKKLISDKTESGNSSSSSENSQLYSQYFEELSNRIKTVEDCINEYDGYNEYVEEVEFDKDLNTEAYFLLEDRVWELEKKITKLLSEISSINDKLQYYEYIK